jgi:iron complex outermembrane receptor protein
MFKRNQYALVSASILSLVWAAPAFAQDTDNDTIVVTGRKTSSFGERSGIAIEQMPQGVQVLTAEDLEDRNVRSVGDALRSIPSASVGTPRTSAYQSFSLRIRGFLADQMRNGVRQRYYEDVDASALSNVERIEVLKGPSSVLFGQSAVGGVISIVTKRPEQEFGGAVWGAVGSYDQALAGFDITGPLSDNLFYRFNTEIERSGTFVDFQDLDRENVSFSLTWTPSADVTAYLVTEWVERRTMRNPGLPLVGTVVSNGVADIPTERFLGEPSLSHLEAFAPLVQTWADIELSTNWTLTPRLSYSGFDSNFVQLRVRDVAADGVTVNRNGRFGKEDDRYGIAQIDLNGRLNALGMSHEVLMGVEYDNERASFYQENIAAVPSINALNPIYGVTASRPYPFTFLSISEIEGWAGYFQDIITPNDALTIILGARYSTYDSRAIFNGVADDTSADTLTYQAGAAFDLTGDWSIYGGYNTGFDIESAAGARSFTGDVFSPEESDQVEAGLRYSGDRLRGSASLFRIRRTNVLTDDPINLGFQVQTGEVEVSGLELEASWQLSDALLLQGGYAYLGSEVTQSNNGDQGDDVADTPNHQANLFVRYQIPNSALELRAGANYVGERQFSNADVTVFPGLLASDVSLPSYATLDLGASYALGDVRIDLTISNVTDERYFTREFNDFSVFPGEPRQAILRLRRDF